MENSPDSLIKENEIVEKKLGIPPDYQLKAINSKNFFQSNWHKNKLLIIHEYIKLNKEMDVLDLGMGSGNFELENHNKVKSITCVDYNSDAIEFLKQKSDKLGIDNLTLITEDIRNLRSLNESKKYDLIILTDVIEHIKLEEAEDVVKELKRLLKPDGSIIVITPNYKSLWLLIESVLDKFTIVPKFAGEQHLSKYYKKNLTSLFENEGLTTKHFCSFNLVSFTIPLRTLSRSMCILEKNLASTTGNLICGVFTLHETEINLWKEHYSEDQEQLYKNKLVKAIFDQGHKYIAKHSASGKSILDIGCGLGYHLNFEDLEGERKYICLDSDQKMLDKINLPVQKIKAKCENIPLPDDSIDTVIASHILEHSTDIESTLSEIKRILKKEGKLIVTLPCDPGLLWKIASYLSPSRARLRKAGLSYDLVMKHEHLNSFLECKKRLDQNFEVLDETYHPTKLKNYHLNLIYSGVYKNLK